MMNAHIYELIMKDSKLSHEEIMELDSYFRSACGDLHSTVFSEAYNEGFHECGDRHLADAYATGVAVGFMKTRFRIAFNMLKYQIDFETISDYTELPLDLLKELQSFSRTL